MLPEANTVNLVLYLLYGLVFIVMGVAVYLQRHRTSELFIARELKYLALFGITHGFSEWVEILIPLDVLLQGTHSLAMQLGVLFLLKILSFTFLLQFAVQLIARTRRRQYWMTLLPLFLLAFWVGLLPLFFEMDGDGWRIMEIWSRYLLAFPSALAAAYALWLQRPNFREAGMRGSIIRSLNGSAAAMTVYAIAGGIIVPPADFFPASVINSQTFQTLTYCPIQVLRGLCGFSLAWFTVRFLAFFDMEELHRREQAEMSQAVCEERERIGRDLHDGIIQSIFGVGLLLHPLQDKHPAVADAIVRIDDAITKLRRYIQALPDEPVVLTNTHIAAVLQGICPATLELRCDIAVAMDRLTAKQMEHVEYILREAVSNVVRHASANRVTVVCDMRNDQFHVGVLDDGVGFLAEPATENERHGLKNIAKRAMLLGGEATVTGVPGRGTEVAVRFPCSP